MIKLEYWLFGVLTLAIIVVAFVGFIQKEKLSENKKENFKEEIKETEKIKDMGEEAEKNDMAPISTGVKLIPVVTVSRYNPINSQVIESEKMDITMGQQWNKNTKLKYCVRYKSNSLNHRSVVLFADSTLENNYRFKINIHGHKTNYGCLLIGGTPSIRGTYYIDVPFEASSPDENAFREICIDDINSQLNHCASKWGISENDAYLTNIYQVSMYSPADSSDDYAIFDYSKIFVDGNQVSESLFPNQDFSKFSGLVNDDSPDDFAGWSEYRNAYAVDIQK